jgi:hypothetical protein
MNFAIPIIVERMHINLNLHLNYHFCHFITNTRVPHV